MDKQHIMEQEQLISKISRLIVKKLNNSISFEEDEMLSKWRASKEKNEELFQRFLSSYDCSRDYQYFQEIKKINDWENIQQKFVHKRIFIWKYLMRFAAILLIGVGCIWAMVKISSGDRVVPVAKGEVGPGCSKAVLTFAGGEKVILGENHSNDSQLLKQYGISANDSILVYNENNRVNEYHTLEVPRGGEYILTLEDGTKVWINAETIIKYPVQFDRNVRKVLLVGGEAYFCVSKDEKRPFYVECKDMNIRVTGTEFNVMAYPEKDRIETTLVDGGVKISTGTEELTLAPQEQAIYLTQNNNLSKKKVDAKYFVSWKDGVFEFREMPLEDVIAQLERWYNVNFTFQDENLRQILFTGAVIKNKSLIFILDIIKETQLIDYSIIENMVLIKRK